MYLLRCRNCPMPMAPPGPRSDAGVVSARIHCVSWRAEGWETRRHGWKALGVPTGPALPSLLKGPRGHGPGRYHPLSRGWPRHQRQATEHQAWRCAWPSESGWPGHPQRSALTSCLEESGPAASLSHPYPIHTHFLLGGIRSGGIPIPSLSHPYSLLAWRNQVRRQHAGRGRAGLARKIAREVHRNSKLVRVEVAVAVDVR